MSLLDQHLARLKVERIDPTEHVSKGSYDDAREAAIKEAVDVYVNQMDFLDQIALLGDTAVHLSDHSTPDASSYEEFVLKCVYNLLEKSWRARNK